MTPKLTCKTDGAQHTPPVIPGNAGDLLSMLLADTPAAFPEILTYKQSQDVMRVDTRLKTGMTNRRRMPKIWINPMRPLFIRFDLPTPNFFRCTTCPLPLPTTRIRYPGGWLGGGAGRPGNSTKTFLTTATQKPCRRAATPILRLTLTPGNHMWAVGHAAPTQRAYSGRNTHD